MPGNNEQGDDPDAEYMEDRMKMHWKMKVLGLALLGLFLVLAGSCEIAGKSFIRIVNAVGTADISVVNIDPTGSHVWGPDLLTGSSRILPGSSLSFEVDPGNYDVRAVDTSGTNYATAVNVLVFEGETVSLHYDPSRPDLY
jgi:hypothetical protein